MISPNVRLFGFTGVEEKIDWMKFPGGELHFHFRGETPGLLGGVLTLRVNFRTSDDIMATLMLYDYLSSQTERKIRLEIDYLAYSRQDRQTAWNEPFTLHTFTSLLRTKDWYKIIVRDPHSDVACALLGHATINRGRSACMRDLARGIEEFNTFIQNPSNLILVSPDAGALKATYEISKDLFSGKVPVIQASKHRDTATGVITKTSVYGLEDLGSLEGVTFLVCDDICDGGKTFIELAKVLKSKAPSAKLVLYITHGIFSKGKAHLLEMYDSLFCLNDMEGLS